MENSEQLFQQAIALHQSGQLQQALDAYRNCLARRPDHAECHHLLGLTEAQLGHLEPAEQALRQAVTQQPENGLYLNNLAEVQRKRGHLPQAIDNFHAALARQPDFATAHHNLALAFKMGGQWSQAEQHLRRAIALKPDYAKAHYNLGNLYLERGQPQLALSCYEHLLQYQPQNVDALVNLGSARQQLKQYEAAIDCYLRALTIAPDNPSAQLNLGVTLQLRGEYEDARTTFQGLARNDTRYTWYALRAAAVFPDIARDNGEIDTLRHALQQRLEAFDQPSPLDLATLHSSSLEPPSQLIYQGRDDTAIKQRYAELFSNALPRFEPPGNREKPRVGFVVTTGHEGVFCKCMRGIVERLPTTDYDVFVVCQTANLAYLRKQIKAPQVRFLPLPKQLDQAREVLSRHPFDLLHYWEIGTDSTNYFLPLLRPARVQCATWGWPASSAMAQVDYFISAERLEAEQADQHYRERLIRLPSLPTYYQRPRLDVPVQSASLVLPQNGTRYLCCQNLRKVHPDLDPLLAGILRRDPSSIVVFIEDRLPYPGRQLRQRWQQAMPDVTSRIHFVPQQSPQEYLALIAAADIILDTPHYGGGANTTYDALALGKVIVTLPGEFHRSRYCSATYHTLGIEGPAAQTAEQYIELAVRLGQDKDFRHHLEQMTLQRCYVLFANDAAVTELHDFLVKTIDPARN